MLAAQARWDGLIREALAHYLIPLKNQSWLQWWEFKLTEQRLMRRIALRTIQFDETGRITFWFSDGGLFLGHDIEVRAYEERGVSEVCLAG